MNVRLIAAAAATAAVAGCGAASSGSAPGAGGGPIATAPPSAAASLAPSPSPRLLPTAPGHPSAGERVVSVAWQLAGVADAGRTLRLRFTIGGCTHDAWAEADETATAVTVAVRALAAVPAAHVMCPAIAMVGTGDVRLEQPLGHRTLRHAAVTRG